MQVDLEAIRRGFEDKDDEALLRIAYASEEEYLAEVIALARESLAGRGIDCDSPEVASRGAEVRERERRLAGEDRPLHPLACVGCLLAGLIVSVIVAVVMAVNGRMRAARDALMWCLAGIGLKLLVAAVVFVILA